MKWELVAPVTPDELKQVLTEGASSTPGPDGVRLKDLIGLRMEEPCNLLGLLRVQTSSARESEVRTHPRVLLSLSCSLPAHKHRPVLTCDYNSILLPVSLIFPVGLFFCVGIHCKGLVGRRCIPLCLFDVFFDDFYSLVIRFTPGPGVLLSLSFSSCTEDVILAKSLCCPTGTQHRFVLSCDQHSFLPAISLTVFLWEFCFTSVFMSTALLVVGASSCACSTCSLTTFTVWSSGSPPGSVSYYLFCCLHARRMF